MSTKTRRRSKPRIRHQDDGNHHLKSLIVVFVAIFAAISIYTYAYTRRLSSTFRTASGNRGGTAGEMSTPLPNTPKGLTSVFGFVKDISSNRLTLQTIVTESGKTSERLILVGLTPKTKVSSVTAEVQGGVAEAATFKRTDTTRALLKTGAAVEVNATSVTDGKGSIVADSIDIYSNR